MRFLLIMSSGSPFRYGWFFFHSLTLTAIVFHFSFLAFSHAAGLTNVYIRDDRWIINNTIVNEGSPAEGLLMNVRMVNAVFEDTGPHSLKNLRTFDPGENVSRFIEMIPEYVAQGIRAFTINLQGGNPGYEGAVNSAYNSDGSLRGSYMARVDRVIRACDRHGAVVILSCFYQRQHSHERALTGRQPIRNAVRNVVYWIMENEFSNVVLEISNEYAHSGFRNWNDRVLLSRIAGRLGYKRAGDWLRSVDGQVELIGLAKRLAPGLLVSTSGMGNGKMAEPIALAADFILLHFNTTDVKDIPERISVVRRYGIPVLCNEDDKVGTLGAEAARLSVRNGAGWGLMLSKRNQHYPFEFDGADDDPAVYHAIKSLTAAGDPLHLSSIEP